MYSIKKLDALSINKRYLDITISKICNISKFNRIWVINIEFYNQIFIIRVKIWIEPDFGTVF